MKLYLAGPMTGYERWNFDAFDHEAARLRAAGFVVHSPHEADLALGFDPDAPVEDFTDEDYFAAIRRDLEALLGVQGVALLDGWEGSRGARFEHSVGRALGLPCEPVFHFLMHKERYLS